MSRPQLLAALAEAAHEAALWDHVTLELHERGIRVRGFRFGREGGVHSERSVSYIELDQAIDPAHLLIAEIDRVRMELELKPWNPKA